MTKETTDTEKALAGNVTHSQIAAWKGQHGEVYRIQVPHDNESQEPYTCYLRKPDRNIIAAAGAYAQSNPVKMNEILLANCWLGGHREIQTNDDLFLSAGAKLGELFKIKEAEIVKL